MKFGGKTKTRGRVAMIYSRQVCRQNKNPALNQDGVHDCTSAN